MISLALLPVIGKGIGQTLAFMWLWVDAKLRRHYNPEPVHFPNTADVLFYDKAFIENLKILDTLKATIRPA